MDGFEAKAGGCLFRVWRGIKPQGPRPPLQSRCCCRLRSVTHKSNDREVPQCSLSGLHRLRRGNRSSDGGGDWGRGHQPFMPSQNPLTLLKKLEPSGLFSALSFSNSSSNSF